MQPKKFVLYLKLLLTAAFWGGTFIAGRVVVKNVGPFSASFLRFAQAAVCLFLVTWKVEGKFPVIKPAHFIGVILLGATGVFTYNIFFFKGLKIIEASRASLIIATCPIFIAVLSSFLFKEKLNLIKIIGIIISVTGAVIVISRGNLIEIVNGGLGRGELYLFICVLSWTAYSLIGKSLMTDYSPLVLVSFASAIGAVASFPPAYFEGMMSDIFHYSVTDWLCIFYLAIFGTVIGFVWYYEGIKKIGPVKAGLFINFVPIWGVTLAFLILAEPVTLSLLIGTVLVVSGVYLTNKTPSAKSI